MGDGGKNEENKPAPTHTDTDTHRQRDTDRQIDRQTHEFNSPSTAAAQTM